LVRQNVEPEPRISFDPARVEQDPGSNADARAHRHAEKLLPLPRRDRDGRIAHGRPMLVVPEVGAVDAVGVAGPTADRAAREARAAAPFPFAPFGGSHTSSP